MHGLGETDWRIPPWIDNDYHKQVTASRRCCRYCSSPRCWLRRNRWLWLLPRR